jgi:glycosyltransferase involved in cell wall biosynthesis
MTYPESLANYGGGGVGCLEIARRMVARGVEVVLVPVARGLPFAGEAAAGTLRPAPPSGVHYLLDGIGLARTVSDVLARRPVDAVLSWTHEGAFLRRPPSAPDTVFGMVAASAGYRLWAERRTALRPVKRLADRWFRDRPLRRADVVFALSGFTRDELVDWLGVEPSRVHVAHWGVHEAFAAVRRPAAARLTRLVFYGSLQPIKGVLDAIEALGRVAAAGHSDWTLRIAGAGDEEGPRRAAERWGIADRITWLGRLDHTALARELAWAQAAILPSHSESFGLAICEAQAAGLPVVAYRTGAVPEVVADGATGWLVEPRRVDLLAESIARLMNDPDEARRMGEAGRVRVTGRFSWDQTVATMLEVIAAAKERRRAQRGGAPLGRPAGRRAPA